MSKYKRNEITRGDSKDGGVGPDRMLGDLTSLRKYKQPGLPCH